MATGSWSRRRFLESAAAGAAASVVAPTILCAKKTASALPVVGTEEHRYEVTHDWPQLPAEFTWQTTHNVAFDAAGLLYVIHEGRLDQTDHPAIFVFDPAGKLVRSFGSEFQGGGHGLEIRHEGGQEFLYVCAYHQQRSIAKLDLLGEKVWRQGAPLESGFYAEGEAKFPRPADDNPWTRESFLPTNIAFHPDGDFFVADGYGAYRIHRYRADGTWLSSFGMPGDDQKKDGTFNLPHGIWIDDRQAGEPRLVVADRANARLQWFTLAGEHLETLDGFILPANIDCHGELLLVPDLFGRVTLLDGKNEVIAHLGDDSARIQADIGDNSTFDIRTNESQWQPGKFVHPHDACFDAEGNILVAEWVERGRVSRLRRVS